MSRLVESRSKSSAPDSGRTGRVNCCADSSSCDRGKIGEGAERQKRDVEREQLSHELRENDKLSLMGGRPIQAPRAIRSSRVRAQQSISAAVSARCS